MYIEAQELGMTSLTTSGEYFSYSNGPFRSEIPAELRSGWIHVAHTYNPTESGGTLRSYVNGKLTLMSSNLALRGYGSEGAYVKL